MEAALSDRRRALRRRSIEEHGIVSARVRPGYEAELIDVSAGGALVECVRRLLPGTAIALYLVGGERCALVRGRVLRCAVVRLKATSICYRGAIAFDCDLHWFPNEHASEWFHDGPPSEYSVRVETPTRQRERERATAVLKA